METAVVARGIIYHRPNCGIGNSNDAEWLALIHAADVALSIGARDVVMLGDSALVVGQASRSAKCKRSEFQQYFEQFSTLACNFDRMKIRHIARSQNLAGIALAHARR
jgi:ribonuclease HI